MSLVDTHCPSYVIPPSDTTPVGFAVQELTLEKLAILLHMDTMPMLLAALPLALVSGSILELNFHLSLLLFARITEELFGRQWNLGFVHLIVEVTLDGSDSTNSASGASAELQHPQCSNLASCFCMGHTSAGMDIDASTPAF
eukprot:CAMPEP_0178428702 /NCGR_PEP_ID=MMETSP0689_2-20121128/30417_1 /TAXON_ID=160604 /ORGANISM="Amphidinium massartii, Strain CS-259" /LENGTH=141 /DNA_ID=CAMNT_0020050489 /DNA_START=83 /DNA_END=507 /DNA_ORIENTATION=-